MKSENASTSLLFKLMEQFSVKAVGLLVNIILARLLLPDDYGLLAIISVFVNLAQSFVQTGMGTSLVQNKTTRDDDYSTVFFLSFSVALLMTGLLFFIAPLIAQLYAADTLIAPLRVMSLTLPFASLNCILTARLQRTMQFRKIMLSNFLASLISGTAGILAAYCGLRLWALVIHHFANIVAVSVIMSILARWHPHLVFSFQRAKVFFSYGWKLLISNMICSLYHDIRSLVIGKRYSTTDLAYYNKAQQYPDLFSASISESVKSVNLPLLSRAQDSRARTVHVLMTSIAVTAFLLFPILLGLATVADSMVYLLLTEKWAACIPYIQIFCIGNLCSPFLNPSLSLLMASGDGRRLMLTEVVRRALMATTLLITVFVFDSVMAIAIGYALGNYLDAFVISIAVKKYSHTGVLTQLQYVWKSFVAALMMAMVVALAGTVLAGLPIIWKFILQILIGMIVYILLSILLRNEILFSILERFRNSIRNK